jgi:hypothetical protein
MIGLAVAAANLLETAKLPIAAAAMVIDSVLRNVIVLVS